MKKVFLFAALLSSCVLLQLINPTKLNAQSEVDKLSLGLGMGLDYGGFGANLLFYPQKNIGVFGGYGYAIAGTGYNVGAKLRLVSEKSRLNPYFVGMYGYNAAIAVVNQSDLNKLFYGPTVGVGFDFKRKPEKLSCWTFALLLPIRGSEPNNYIDYLKDVHNVEMQSGLFPIAISLGYRIAFF